MQPTAENPTDALIICADDRWVAALVPALRSDGVRVSVLGNPEAGIEQIADRVPT